MVFFKIAAKNLTRVKSRTFLTILAIALGTALMTGITVLNDSYLESYLNGVSSQLGYTDIGVKKHDNVTESFFTIDELNQTINLNEINGVLDHAGRVVIYKEVTIYEDISEDDAYHTTMFGIDVSKDVGYGYAEILNWSEEVEQKLDGKEPETIEDILSLDRSYTVITSWVKEVYDFKVGEEVLIPMANDSATDREDSSSWKKYTVAGVINDFAEGKDIYFDEEVDKAGSSMKSRAMYFHIEETRGMIGCEKDEINLLYLHVKLDQIVKIENQLDGILPSEYYGYNIKSGDLERVYDSVQSMMTILIIFTLISLIIAIMLTLNTLMMSVTEQKYEVGVMRAQGIFKNEIFKLFLYEAFLLSFIGTVVGLVLGLSLSPILKRIFFTTIMSDSEFQLVLEFNLNSILMVLGFTFLINLLIGIVPALLATKIQIIEAIRNISTRKREGKLRKLIFPIVGIIITLLGYYILRRSHRNIVNTLIGIIPFILGLIMISTLLIPILSKVFAYLFSPFLGTYRKLTNRNLGRDPRQTKITFIMFGLAIGFLVMISNVLNSVEIVQYNTVPRYLGSDIVINSEGSTFGMDEILKNDDEFIKGAVENATLLNQMRVKVDGYGNMKNIEPHVNLYIIEGEKFFYTANDIDMLDAGNLTDKQAFKKLDDEPFTAIACHQLLDERHLNKGIGDQIEVNVTNTLFNVTLIGITDFISGFSETWEEWSDVNLADTRGKYCLFVSWQTVISVIEDEFDWLPQSDLVLKGDDDDSDFWDFPLLDRDYVKSKIDEYEKNNQLNGGLKYSERIWDENKTGAIAEAIYDYDHLKKAENEDDWRNIHIAFENTEITGTTKFIESRGDYESVKEALESGTDQCVITDDVAEDLELEVEDTIRFWYAIGEDTPVYKTFTIAGIIKMSETIEAINFHAKNPYISGNWDVGDASSSVIIVDIDSQTESGGKALYEDFFGHDKVFEFWIHLEDYFGDHLKVINDLKEIFGDEYVIADMKWLFTRDYSYAPGWMIQVNESMTQEEALESIREFLLDQKMPAINWNTVDEVREQYADQISFQKAFFNIVLSFALIIAVLGIMINMLIAISNRKREIGMLRAIGTYKGELIKMIIGETMILVFSGFFIGTLIGILASNQLLLGLPLDNVFQLRLYIDYKMILMLFGIVILISLLSAALPCYKVLRLDVIEAMRNV